MNREVHVRFCEGLGLKCPDLLTNYYSNEDARSFSQWTGTGAERLGLRGEVRFDDFDRLLKGQSPEGSELVGRHGNTTHKAGMDLTFSAPKSVSIQAFVQGDTRLIEAHRGAVAAAMAFVEERYSHFRLRQGEERRIETAGNLVVAQFEHDVSRLKDPQLHTHNVVLNLVDAGELGWRAHHPNEMFRDSKLIGLVYQNELAVRAQRLGYDIETNRNGTFEIKGYSKADLEVFSKRRTQLKEMGVETQKEARTKVLLDRTAKGGSQDRYSLRAGWQSEAKDAGTPEVKPHKRGREPKMISAEDLINSGIAQASEKDVAFTESKVIKAALETGLGRTNLANLRKAFEGARGQLVTALNGNGYTTAAALRVEAETRRFVTEGIGRCEPLLASIEERGRLTARLTSLDMAAADVALRAFRDDLSERVPHASVDLVTQPLVAAMRSGVTMRPQEVFAVREKLESLILGVESKADAWTVARDLMKPIEKAFQGPSEGQETAIDATLASRDQVILWQGVAGAGKTFALRQIVEVAKAQGIELKGLAPSATAAIQLQTETSAPSTTIAGHLLTRESGAENTKKLWIVDEAGMVSAKDMHALLRMAKAQSARVILVGDTRQLAAVDWGNPFKDLQSTKAKVLDLPESLRQKDSLLRQAVSSLNAGDFDEALTQLKDNVFQAASRERAAIEVAKAYLSKVPHERENTIVIARTNEERRAITAEIRQGLRDEGTLRGNAIMHIYSKVDVSESRTNMASAFERGDLVVPSRAYRSMGLQKDKGYEVADVDYKRNAIVLDIEGKATRIDLARVSHLSVYRPGSLEIAEGDRMMWLRNVQERKEFNSRLFSVLKVEEGRATIREETGQVRTLNLHERQFADHAWAVTVHKSQGQTRESVLQAFGSHIGSRDLLVGVTRATTDVKLFLAGTGKEQSVTIDPDKSTAIASVSRAEALLALLHSIQREHEHELNAITDKSKNEIKSHKPNKGKNNGYWI